MTSYGTFIGRIIILEPKTYRNRINRQKMDLDWHGESLAKKFIKLIFDLGGQNFLAKNGQK